VTEKKSPKDLGPIFFTGSGVLNQSA